MSDIYCQLIPNEDDNMPNYEIVPRIGAFEVSVNGIVSKTKISMHKPKRSYKSIKELFDFCDSYLQNAYLILLMFSSYSQNVCQDAGHITQLWLKDVPQLLNQLIKEKTFSNIRLQDK